ncbi:MAG: hypothetical protein ACOC44_03820 [Promethearchaeia archaeon]
MSKKEHLVLKWNQNSGKFEPIGSEEDINDGIFLEFIEDEGKWRYFYIEGASLIQRRTALRAAHGIAKTGYVHPLSQIRYGVEFALEEEISAFEDMPKNLRQSQRHWYDPRYKKKKKKK